MGGSYKGELTDTAALFTHYAAGAPQARMSISEVWQWLPQAWREVLRGGVGRVKESEDNAWRVGAMNVEE